MDDRHSTSSIYDEAVAAALRADAAERKISKTAITRATGIPHRTLIRYMNGESPIPVGKLFDITSAIGVTPEQTIEAARRIIKR